MLSLAIAASDAADPTADPDPGDNLAYASTSTPAAAATVTASVPTSSVVQLDFAAPLSRTAAENVGHYQLTTGTGTAVAIRSAQYNAVLHRVTLRLAHPLPASVRAAQLTITGLAATSATGGTTLSLTR